MEHIVFTATIRISSRSCTGCDRLDFMMSFRKKKEKSEDEEFPVFRRVGLFGKVGKLGDCTPTEYDPAEGPPLRRVRTLRGK